jgi:hypothetical protein
MGWRGASALLLAALLAGCAENQQYSGLSAFATATPEPVARTKPQADASFRMSELKPGLTKAELQALYPSRLLFGSGDARNELYFVESPGVAPRSKVARDRLVLWLNDGKLATFDVMRTDETVMLAAPALLPPRAAPPPGKYGVQIAARRSEAEARALVDEMRAKFPSQLGREWATLYRVALPQGVFYRVVVGPLGLVQQAMQLCNDLKAQGAECLIRGRS